MKKILIATNVLTLAILFCVVFKNQMSAKAQPEIGKNALYNKPPLCDTNQLPWKTLEEFSRAVAQYRNNHYDVYNNSPYAVGGNPTSNFKDSRSFFYSFQRLRQFMCVVEQATFQYNNLNTISKIDASKLGIRFYYCEYPKDANNPLEKRHTLFLTSTYADGIKSPKNIDFDAFKTLSTRQIVPLWKLIQATPTSGLNKVFPTILGPSSDVLNQGDLCPPSTGCSQTISEIDARFTGQQN